MLVAFPLKVNWSKTRDNVEGPRQFMDVLFQSVVGRCIETNGRCVDTVNATAIGYIIGCKTRHDDVGIVLRNEC